MFYHTVDCIPAPLIQLPFNNLWIIGLLDFTLDELMQFYTFFASNWFRFPYLSE